MYQRLQKLGLCLSHSRTIKLIDLLGDQYDSVVKQWKTTAEDVFVTSSLSVRMLIFIIHSIIIVALAIHIRYY